MAEQKIQVCDVCRRYPPEVEAVTRYTIRREDGGTARVDLCEDHEKPLLELVPSLQLAKKRGDIQVVSPAQVPKKAAPGSRPGAGRRTPPK